MQVSHFILDPETGEGVGVVSHIDETEQGAFGVVHYFDEERNATYEWLAGLTLLKPEDASPAFRRSVAEQIGSSGVS